MQPKPGGCRARDAQRYAYYFNWKSSELDSGRLFRNVHDVQKSMDCLQIKGNVVHALVGKDYDAFWQALGASPSAAAGYMLACAQAILDAACSASTSMQGMTTEEYVDAALSTISFLDCFFDIATEHPDFEQLLRLEDNAKRMGRGAGVRLSQALGRIKRRHRQSEVLAAHVLVECSTLDNTDCDAYPFRYLHMQRLYRHHGEELNQELCRILHSLRASCTNSPSVLQQSFVARFLALAHIQRDMLAHASLCKATLVRARRIFAAFRSFPEPFGSEVNEPLLAF